MGDDLAGVFCTGVLPEGKWDRVFLGACVDFPRSVRFCVRMVDEMLHNITGTTTGRYSNRCEKLAGALLARLNFAGPSDVLERGLHNYIDDLQVALNETGQAIFETYVLIPQDTNQSVVQWAPFDPLGYHFQKQQQQQQ
jgi:A predicted alpha-helical domain with a conserved ER motif.